MNPMIAALQKSRTDSMSSSGPMPGKGPQPSGDMEKYWSMLQDMNKKLDNLISLIGGNAPAESKENENGNGNGY